MLTTGQKSNVESRRDVLIAVTGVTVSAVLGLTFANGLAYGVHKFTAWDSGEKRYEAVGGAAAQSLRRLR